MFCQTLKMFYLVPISGVNFETRLTFFSTYLTFYEINLGNFMFKVVIFLLQLSNFIEKIPFLSFIIAFINFECLCQTQQRWKRKRYLIGCYL